LDRIAKDKTNGILHHVMVVGLVAICCATVVSAAMGSIAGSDARGDDFELLNAIKALQDTIRADPGQAENYLALADLYMSSSPRDVEAAVITLQTLLDIHPDSSDAYLRLATAEILLGHQKAAVRALEGHRRLTTGS